MPLQFKAGENVETLDLTGLEQNVPTAAEPDPCALKLTSVAEMVGEPVAAEEVAGEETSAAEEEGRGG